MSTTCPYGLRASSSCGTGTDTPSSCSEMTMVGSGGPRERITSFITAARFLGSTRYTSTSSSATTGLVVGGRGRREEGGRGEREGGGGGTGERAGGGGHGVRGTRPEGRRHASRGGKKVETAHR